jgi:hypothetical protein
MPGAFFILWQDMVPLQFGAAGRYPGSLAGFRLCREEPGVRPDFRYLISAGWQLPGSFLFPIIPR